MQHIQQKALLPASLAMQHRGSPSKACVGGPCSASEAASENPSREKEKDSKKQQQNKLCKQSPDVSGI